MTNLKQALSLQNSPDITQTILNLAEFMEHCEEATVSMSSYSISLFAYVHYSYSYCFVVKGRLPLGSELLGECAMNCRAYAKALHYKVHSSITVDAVKYA